MTPDSYRVHRRGKRPALAWLVCQGWNVHQYVKVKEAFRVLWSPTERATGCIQMLLKEKKKKLLSQAWCHQPVISVLERLKQEDWHQFEVSLAYVGLHSKY